MLKIRFPKIGPMSQPAALVATTTMPIVINTSKPRYFCAITSTSCVVTMYMLKKSAPATPIVEVITLSCRRTLRISRNRFHVNGCVVDVLVDEAADTTEGEAVVDARRTWRASVCIDGALVVVFKVCFDTVDAIRVLQIVDCCLNGIVKIACDREAFGVALVA
jgi:hypothetical protein